MLEVHVLPRQKKKKSKDAPLLFVLVMIKIIVGSQIGSLIQVMVHGSHLNMDNDGMRNLLNDSHLPRRKPPRDIPLRGRVQVKHRLPPRARPLRRKNKVRDETKERLIEADAVVTEFKNLVVKLLQEKKPKGKVFNANPNNVVA